jgi:hypothetical protein
MDSDMSSTLLTQRNQPGSMLAQSWGFRWLQAGLAAVMGVLGLSATATAAERITLQYGATERIFLVRNIEAFTQTGQAVDPELQAFFETHPEVRRILQTVFGAEIYISPRFVSRIESRAGSPTGSFVLTQLNKFVNTNDVTSDLEPLETALISSLKDDNRFSLVELVSRYSESEIHVDLTGLEPVYNDVKGFVERVVPALEVASDYLQNIVCDCQPEQTAQTPITLPVSSSTAVLSLEGRSAGCIETVTQVSVGQEALVPPSTAAVTEAATPARNPDPAVANAVSTSSQTTLP